MYEDLCKGVLNQKCVDLPQVIWINIIISTNEYELKLLKYHSKYSPKIRVKLYCTNNLLVYFK